MSKYTMITIKKTAVYKANIEAVRAIYPGREKDFARELKIAANSPTINFKSNDSRIIGVFCWANTPQGHDCWGELHNQICEYHARKAEA